jgi:hypothetical protein
VLLAPELLHEVLRHVDGTTLTRASGVCRRWWQAAGDDLLWRDRCFRERHAWVGPVPRSPVAPRWAIERARDPACPEPPRSWRQAYRLLAMVEHGRPEGGFGPPELVVDATLGPPPRWRAVAPPQWRGIRETDALLAPLFGRWRPLEWELYAAMRTDKRQLTELAGTVAIRDGTGDVLLAWHERDQPRLWHLPVRRGGLLASEVPLLRPSGQLASEVRLLPREPGDPRGVGNAHVLTRCGHRWLRWQPGQATAAAIFPGRAGQLVRAQGRPFWLGADWPDATYSQLSLCDFDTGAVLQRYSDNYLQTGATLLTELGPMVGWVAGGWQGRIVWSSSAEVLAPNLRPVDPREPWRAWGNRLGNRPQRLEAALPRGARVVDSALSEDVPGRVLLWWTDGAQWPPAIPLASGYVDGWGLTGAADIVGLADRPPRDCASGPGEDENR